MRVGAGGNDSESWHVTAFGISGICSTKVLVIFSCGFQGSYFDATSMPASATDDNVEITCRLRRIF